MPEYLANGGDGYYMLKECEKGINTVNSIDMLTLIDKFFLVKGSEEKSGWQKSKLNAQIQHKEPEAQSEKCSVGFFDGLLKIANKQVKRIKRMN